MNPSASTHVLVRGQVLHFVADPGPADAPAAWQYFDDGALWISDGHIHAAGPWSDISAALPPGIRHAATLHDHRGHLVLPGFIDCHLHYPQAGVIASFGRQLLDWLNDYTFPAEARFADVREAERSAAFVVDRLLAHGTTTASVFATVHAHSVDAFFNAASAVCGQLGRWPMLRSRAHQQFCRPLPGRQQRQRWRRRRSCSSSRLTFTKRITCMRSCCLANCSPSP